MTETERVRPKAMAVEEAIALALDSRWSDAVSVNRRLLEQHGPDEDAYNRLGKALSELGELKEALASYQHTLELNPLNLIAPKMVRKLTALLETPAKVEGSNAAIDVDLFTEEPGKSGLTTFQIPRGGAGAAVVPGDVVDLSISGTQLKARTARGVELGDVDTKIARRLIPLMQTGNTYTAAVARIDDSKAEVMIREAYQSPVNSRKASFAVSRSPRRDEFRPYAKESLLATRGTDDEGLDLDDEGTLAAEPADDEELDGMQTVEADLDEAGVVDTVEDDEVDDDARPEDHY